jgi:predicted metal-dependent hydrolase
MAWMIDNSFPESAETMVDGRSVAVAVRVSARARSYRLTITHHGRPVLTVPRYGRWREAEAFLNRHNAWLAARLKRAARPVPLRPGETIPLRGVEHLVVASGSLRGRVGIETDAEGARLIVPGAPEHQARRLADWLKAEARRDIEARVFIHAERLGVTVTGISLRSQSTRWGSCSSRGRLNFNWRLVLAPPFVLDYVAAHEVAHRREMNHSAAFWATVKRTLPDMDRGRAWLKAHGGALMAYGAED